MYRPKVHKEARENLREAIKATTGHDVQGLHWSILANLLDDVDELEAELQDAVAEADQAHRLVGEYGARVANLVDKVEKLQGPMTIHIETGEPGTITVRPGRTIKWEPDSLKEDA